jgi:hypothetical protein
MNHLGTVIDYCITASGEILEFSFRLQKNLPHYMLLSRPIYKSCVDKIGCVWATGISTLATTMIMHDIIPAAAKCAHSYTQMDSLESSEGCNMSINYWSTAQWTSWALLVMYVKYKRSKGQQLVLNLPQLDLLKFILESKKSMDTVELAQVVLELDQQREQPVESENVSPAPEPAITMEASEDLLEEYSWGI